MLPAAVRAKAQWAAESLDGLVPFDERPHLELDHPHQRFSLRPDELLEGQPFADCLVFGGWSFLACLDGAVVGQVWVQEIGGELSASVGRSGNEQALAAAFAEPHGDDVAVVSLPTIKEEALWLRDCGQLRRRPQENASFHPAEDEQALIDTWRLVLEYAKEARELEHLQGLLAAVQDGAVKIGARPADKDEGEADDDDDGDLLGVIEGIFGAASWVPDQDDDAHA